MTYSPTPATPRPVPPRKRHLVRNFFIFASAALLLVIVVAIATQPGDTRPAPGGQKVPAIPAAQPPSQTPTVPPGGIAGEGTFTVPTEVAPGVYKTDGPDPNTPVPNCYWARLSGTSGELADVVANGNATGPVTVTIRKTDRAFQSQGCLPWRKTG